MKTDIVLLILIGLPGCGKTSLSRLLKEKIGKKSRIKSESDIDVHLICFDEIVSLENQGKYVRLKLEDPSSTAWKDSRSIFFDKTESTIKSIRNNYNDRVTEPILENVDSLSDNTCHVLILDDNFYYKSMRYKFYQLAMKYNCGFIQICIDCNLNEAIFRNENRSSIERISPDVIKKMKEKLEIPLSSENMWEENSLILTSDWSLHIESILDGISTTFLMGLKSRIDNSKMIDEARQACLKSLIHRADIILRDIVASKIKVLKNEHALVSKSSLDLKLMPSEINGIRKNILSRIKQEKSFVPLDLYEQLDSGKLSIFIDNQFKVLFDSLIE